MATLYRWNKSTIGVGYSREQKTGSWTYDALGINGYYIYGSASYTYNNNGTVTLNDPVTTSDYISYGHPFRGDGTLYWALSKTTSELFKPVSSSNYISAGYQDGEKRIGGYNPSTGSVAAYRYYNFRDGAGTFQEYVYATSAGAYPEDGKSGKYWYSNRTTITINITVPSIIMQGNEIPISWNTVSGATEYFLERQADGGSWTQVYNGSATSYTDTAGTWSNVKYRLRMTISSTMTPYVESSTCKVVDASALAISGTDGDLGTLTNDVEYTVISNGDSAITVTEAVDGVYTKTFTATAGATNKISVLDLLTGTGSIRITASTNPGSGVIEVERAWTYSKTAAMFSAYGNTAELNRNGVPVWPLTLAECVRLPGGKTLDEVTALTVANIETGSYKGTGTYGATNKNRLEFAFEPILVLIMQSSTSTPSAFGIFLRGCQTGPSTFDFSQNKPQGCNLTWGSDYLEFDSSTSAAIQLNSANAKYRYVAIGLAGGDTE